jgi:hypothetical protein
VRVDAAPPGNDPPEVDAGAGSVVGSVSVLTGPSFDTDVGFRNATVRVSAPSLSGGRASVSYDGSADFVLPGLTKARNVWFGVEQTAGAEQLVTTLQVRDTTQGDDLELAIVSFDALDSVASLGLLSVPATLDASRGHALLNFVDDDGAPLSGVSIESASGTTIAYDAGDTYSDALDETSVRGSVIVFNVRASSFPGGAQTVTIGYQGESESFDIQVAREALTLYTHVL